MIQLLRSSAPKDLARLNSQQPPHLPRNSSLVFLTVRQRLLPHRHQVLFLEVSGETNNIVSVRWNLKSTMLRL